MSGQQPQLPERKIPASVEYMPAAGKVQWVAGLWPELSKEFYLEEKELPAWHDVLAGQGRPWLVIRRIFHVAAIFGDPDDTDSLRPWKYSELSDHLGVSEKALREDMASAVDHWRKMRVANASRQKQANDSAPDDAESGGFAFAIHREIADKDVGEILAAFRFSHIKDARDRLYVANRILELRHLLENKLKRESARQLIVMELNLSAYETGFASLKDALARLSGKGGTYDEERSKEIRQLSSAIAEAEKSITILAEKHRKASDEIGEADIEEYEKKRVALETISYFIEATRRYYEDGSRTLVDGVFTAEELVWSTTPLTIGRPAQYRPDIVLRVREAMEPENLWDGDYKPTVIQREACRRMLRLSQALSEEMEPETIPEIDDNMESGDDDEASFENIPAREDDDFVPPVDITGPSMQESDEECMAIS